LLLLLLLLVVVVVGFDHRCRHGVAVAVTVAVVVVEAKKMKDDDDQKNQKKERAQSLTLEERWLALEDSITQDYNKSIKIALNQRVGIEKWIHSVWNHTFLIVGSIVTYMGSFQQRLSLAVHAGFFTKYALRNIDRQYLSIIANRKTRKETQQTSSAESSSVIMDRIYQVMTNPIFKDILALAISFSVAYGRNSGGINNDNNNDDDDDNRHQFISNTLLLPKFSILLMIKRTVHRIIEKMQEIDEKEHRTLERKNTIKRRLSYLLPSSWWWTKKRRRPRRRPSLAEEDDIDKKEHNKENEITSSSLYTDYHQTEDQYPERHHHRPRHRHRHRPSIHENLIAISLGIVSIAIVPATDLPMIAASFAGTNLMIDVVQDEVVGNWYDILTKLDVEKKHSIVKRIYGVVYKNLKHQFVYPLQEALEELEDYQQQSEQQKDADASVLPLFHDRISNAFNQCVRLKLTWIIASSGITLQYLWRYYYNHRYPPKNKK
jgi:hypothetical protein